MWEGSAPEEEFSGSLLLKPENLEEKYFL